MAELHYQGSDFVTAARLYGDITVLLDEQEEAGLGSYFEKLGARAAFLKARAFERAGDWEQAEKAYASALPLMRPIGDAVNFRMAVCRLEQDDLEGATSLLRAIVEDGEETSFDERAVEALGDAHRRFSEWDLAIQWYRLLLARAPSYDEQARIHTSIGMTHEARGDRETAMRSYARVVDEFPRSRHAHDAMKEARKLSRSFTDRYHQGLVLYNRRLYADAAEFFEHYIRNDDDATWRLEATYYLGRANQRLGRYDAAAKHYAAAIAIGEGDGGGDGTATPDSEEYHLAWQRLAYARRVLGDAQACLCTYDDYVARHPSADHAADVLWEKARFLEDEKRWDEAAEVFALLAERYPHTERAGDARFRRGLVLYKNGDREAAEAAFTRDASVARGEDLARAAYWLGKTREALGHRRQPLVDYRRARESAPDSYYGRRASESLVRLGVVDPAPERDPSTAALRRARVRPAWANGPGRDYGAWLATWAERTYVPIEYIAVRERLMADRWFVRADHLRAVHMDENAEEEFSRLEESTASDPTMLSMLVDYYERSGLNRRGIRLAERILRMSPVENASEAPVYLAERIFPRHFEDVVEPECFERGVDANLYYGLMRQESVFESDAVSWVGARGLSQIMPATGRWIARRIDHGRFRLDHLMDPSTNIRFGAYYLAEQLAEFQGDPLRALAAYNGGPRNVPRWWGYGGCDDVDVFVEDIGYAETSDYVRRVYAYWRLYEEIYGRSPAPAAATPSFRPASAASSS